MNQRQPAGSDAWLSLLRLAPTPGGLAIGRSPSGWWASCGLFRVARHETAEAAIAELAGLVDEYERNVGGRRP